MNYMNLYKSWLNNESMDKATKEELLSIKDNPKEIEDRFYKELEFGTAGIRGIIGAGINRMNSYTVGKATQGLADYIKSQGQEAMDRGVVIAHDPRHRSEEFAERVALVLNGNGIKAYLYDELQPTPLLSFSVRELKTISGIVITASHNPPEYNGYKVYWEDGAQIDLDRANDIIAAIGNIKSYDDVLSMDREEALDKGLLNILDDSIIDKYMEKVLGLSLNKELVQYISDNMKIIYTPLHGTGNKLVRRALKEIGFKNVDVVKEQELPDPDFSTVGYPNPEEKRVFELAIEMANRDNDVDIILGTDPDCDRVGVVVKDDKGEYIVISGNQLGALLTNYIIRAREAKDLLPKNALMIKTIVTDRLGESIARSLGVDVMETLTGFKFIGEKIKEFEETGEYTYIFGYEESYGYLAGDFVRDKDGVSTSMLICEMAAYYKSKSMTLYDGIKELWDDYGYYYEDLALIEVQGKEGMERIDIIMNAFRDNLPKSFAGRDILVFQDYSTSISKDLLSGETSKIELPESNVLHFSLEDDAWFAIRPSGTEPNIKIYFSAKSSSLEASRALVKEIRDDVERHIDNI